MTLHSANRRALVRPRPRFLELRGQTEKRGLVAEPGREVHADW